MGFHYAHENTYGRACRALMDQVMLFRSTMTPRTYKFIEGVSVVQTVHYVRSI